MSSSISYISPVVDVCPATQQYLDYEDMPVYRGQEKRRVPTLHRIDIHSYAHIYREIYELFYVHLLYLT